MALRLFALLGLFISLSGCTTLISEVKPGRQSVIGIYEVDAQLSWNRRNEYGNDYDGPAMTWTRNGMPVDYLLFFRPVESGQGLASKVFPGVGEKLAERIVTTGSHGRRRRASVFGLNSINRSTPGSSPSCITSNAIRTVEEWRPIDRTSGVPKLA